MKSFKSRRLSVEEKDDIRFDRHGHGYDLCDAIAEDGESCGEYPDREVTETDGQKWFLCEKHFLEYRKSHRKSPNSLEKVNFT